MAYKRELIINNGSLTSYKKLLKVSDVCQLLDKSKYLATQTINGVTFTNNGDGTITVNGTATKETNLLLNNNEVPIIKNHIYCVLGSPFGGSSRTYYTSTSWGSEDGNGIIQKNTRDIISGNYYIHIEPNYTANNLVFIPQVFDLTEMYGAGNEPKTVAEFKAKFPNEMYDYSPRCWVTSYKTGLIAKTKNLFDYIPPMQKEYDGANITYLESLSNGAIVTGAVGYQPGLPNWSNGWFSPAYSSYSNTPLTPLKSGDVITVSADCTLLKAYSASSMFTRILSSDDSKVSASVVSIPLELGKTKRISQTFTIISDIDFRPVFTLNSNKVKITNIQIEKGSTATNYVPYGYL